MKPSMKTVIKKKQINKHDPSAPLDDYEKELLKSIENDEFVSVPNKEEEIKKLVDSAKYTLRILKKDKRVTIRVPKQDLEHIQNKAIETGIPYQTLIASILHQFATNKIRLNI